MKTRITPLLVLLAGLLIAPMPACAEETLSALLARVLPLDPQVRVQIGLVAAAEQRVVQARSRFLPELQLELNRGKANSDSLGLPIDRSTNRAQASLGQNLYNGGRDRAELEAVQLEVDAARQDLEHARAEATERIAAAYLDLLRFSALQDAVEERLRKARTVLARFAEQHKAGKVSDADYIEASSVGTEAELELEDIRASALQARAKLLRLIGEPKLEVIAWPDAQLRASQPDRLAADALPAQTLAARLRAYAAQARVPPAWSVVTPRVDLRYDRALYDHTSPALTDQLNKGWAIAVRWSFPLGSETVSRVSESQRRAEAALAEAERIQLGVMSELAGLPDRIASSERSAQLLRQRLDQFAQLLPATELQYEAGRRSLTQLGQMYEQRFAVQRRAIEQQQQLRSLHLHLLGLSGGLLQALGLDAAR